MKVSVWILVALSVAAVSAVDFLDLTTTASSTKLHKVDVDKQEIIGDNKASKYNATDGPTEKVTTSIPHTTTAKSTDKPTTIRTTTSSIPFDPTTDKIKTTTTKSSDVVPRPESHAMRWVLGALFVGIFVVIVSMFAYKFYRSRAESSYQNL